MRTSRILKKLYEDYAKYSDKDWESIFEKELSYIKDEEVKTIVLFSLEYFANDMDKTGPASSTGKYHPDSDNGEGGLIRHTKAVTRFTVDLINKYEHKGMGVKAGRGEEYNKDENGLNYDAPFDKEYDPIFDYRDEMIAAAILHDIAKYDRGDEEQEEIDAKWKENPEKYFRKPVLINYTKRLYRTPVGGFEAYLDDKGNPSFVKSRGWWKCDFEHPPVGGWESVVNEEGEQCTKCEKPIVYTKVDHPKRMADYVRQLEHFIPLPGIVDKIETIADLIECHEGKWNEGNGKKWKSPRELANDILTKCADIVSTADYVASRDQNAFEYDENGDLAITKDDVHKAKQKRIADDNKEEIEEVKAEIKDLQIIVDSGEATEREKKALERDRRYLKKLLGESAKRLTEAYLKENTEEVPI